METIKVSVLMAVYNEPISQLSQSVLSIQNQTYKNFEFIIICDNPQREDLLVFLQSLKSDKRIRIEINDSNIGLTKSLNNGIRLAKGDYIVRMDADDISYADRIDTQIKFMEANQRILASGSWVRFIDDNNNPRGEYRIQCKSSLIEEDLFFDTVICHPSAIFRRIINNRLVQYDESIRYAQDYALWEYIQRYGALANVPKVLLDYRISQRQISNAKIDEQRLCAQRTRERVFTNRGFIVNEEFINIFSQLYTKQPCKFSKEEVRLIFSSFLTQNKKKIKSFRLLSLFCFLFIESYDKEKGLFLKQKDLFLLVKFSVHKMIALQLVLLGKTFTHVLTKSAV